MRTVIALLAAVLVASCAHTGGVKSSGAAQTQAAKDEAALAAELSGKIAGPAQECLRESDLGPNRFYGNGVLVFRSYAGGVVYVNRLLAPCTGVVYGRAVRITETIPQLCRGDVVTVIEPESGAEVGTCVVGEFTPYRPSH
jgi:hypothetical protein